MKKTLETEGYTADMVLEPSGKQSKKEYINQRLDDLRGMTIDNALKRYVRVCYSIYCKYDIFIILTGTHTMIQRETRRETTRSPTCVMMSKLDI